MQWFQALIPVPITRRICSVDFLSPDARKLRVDINSDLFINACEWYAQTKVAYLKNL